MRQSKFEELVNLYLDGEISRGELNRLCRELRKSPKRRAVFDSYRRLHSATCHARFSATCLIEECRVLREGPSFAWAAWGGLSGALVAVVAFIFMGWSEPVSQSARPAPLFAQARMEVEGLRPVALRGLSETGLQFSVDSELASFTHSGATGVRPDLSKIDIPSLHNVLGRMEYHFPQPEVVRFPTYTLGSLGDDSASFGTFVKVSSPASR